MSEKSFCRGVCWFDMHSSAGCTHSFQDLKMLCPTNSLSLQQMARRSALGLMAGAAALLSKTKPSEAAFGDAANVFGR